MTSRAPAPIPFDEEEYLGISERLPDLFVDLHRQLSAPHAREHDGLTWLGEFTAFKHIIEMSMLTLNDRNKPAVNYCLNTLGPMADYCALSKRLVRELEWRRWGAGAGQGVLWERVVEDALRLAVVLDRVREAWKVDLGVGAEEAAKARWRRGLRRGSS